MAFEMFLKAFEEGRKDHYKPKAKDHQFPQIENGDLSPEKAAEKMNKQVLKNMDMLAKV